MSSVGIFNSDMLPEDREEQVKNGMDCFDKADSIINSCMVSKNFFARHLYHLRLHIHAKLD